MSELYVGLLHYPVYNKTGNIVVTSVTNLDLHDIARLCATYDINRYYIIQPDVSQQQLVQEITGFWKTEQGMQYNPDRSEAFKRLEIVDSLESAKADMIAQGMKPKLVVTDAKHQPDMISYTAMKQKICSTDKIGYLLLFGTGWGISEKVMKQADFCLPPIVGRGSYNHLSVRSAAAIILDRLLGGKI